MPDNHHIPLPGDPQRQASPTLRAYHYQIWQTVLAWLQLESDQQLWVEQAEDFDVTGPTGAETVQVSHSLHRITLRDEKIREAIANFWQLKENAPGRPIRFRYITRGEAGVESRHPFGVGISGLSQWALSARDVDAASRLLDFLRSERNHYSSPSFQSFLDTASPAEAVQTLFAPLRFELGVGDTAAVQGLINLQLVLIAQSGGIMPAAALRTRSELFSKVCAVAGQSLDRWLTPTHLQVQLAASMGVMVRHEFEQSLRQVGELSTAVRELLGLYPALAAIVEAPLPPPRDSTPRGAVLTALRNKLRECQIVFAQGSSGMGKTTLARFLTSQEPDVWQWVAMAGLRGEAVVQKLRALRAEMARSSASFHLIVDDVDVSAAVQTQLDDTLSTLAVLLRQRGGEILITTQVRPSTRIIDACSTDASPVFVVPAMTEQENRDLALLLGCPEGQKLELWGTFAWLQSQGHPQLARAALLDAKARGWPTTPVGASSPRINDVRTEARRLVSTLPEPEKVLLLRLSLMRGSFRREHALRLASEPPPLARPGEAFDPLIGAWIEPMSASTYRVSPLLYDAAEEVYDAETVRTVRVQIAKTLLGETPSPSEGALAFQQVWEAGHEDALGGLTVSLLRQRPGGLRTMAFHLGWFAVESLRPGEQLFPANPGLSTTLRWLQLSIAAEIVPAYGARIFRAWLAEIDRLPDPDARSAGRFMAIAEVLQRSDLPLPAQDVIDSLGLIFDMRDRREAVYVMAEEGAQRATMESAREFHHADFAELQTVLSLNRCRSVTWLDEWLTAIESLDGTRRERLLPVLRQNGWWCGMMIDTAWLDEELKPVPDWVRCLQVLRRVQELAARWNVPALVVAAVRASTTVRDEYRHEPEIALRNLDDFLASHADPPPRLLDVRATVLFHLGDYAGAVAGWDAILPTWHAENSEDRYPGFACRMRAIALARLGDFPAAARGFLDARDRLPQGSGATQSVGLLADVALCWWKANERETALTVLTEAVRAADALPSGHSDLLAFRMRRVVGHIVSVLHHQVTDWAVENEVEPPIGFASDLAAPENLRDLREGPFAYVWMILGRLANALNRDMEVPPVEQASLENTQQTVIGFFAGRTAVETACRQGRLQDLPRLATALDQEWSRGQETLLRLRAAAGQLGNSPIVIGWQSEVAGEPLFRAGAVIAAARGILRETIEAWRADPVTLPWGTAFQTWLDGTLATFDLPLPEASRRLREETAALSANNGMLTAARVAADMEAAPPDSARSHVQLLLAFSTSLWRVAAGFALSELFERIWRRHVTQTALLRTPRITVPAVLAACDERTPGVAKAAAIILAALSTVDMHVGASILNDLRRLRDNQLPLGRTADPFAAFGPPSDAPTP